ncbi:hypothetical protein DSECCO2_582630 [anaerobic digester metagenome]
MAINTFAEKATKFLSVLDEVYKRGSLTAILDDAALASQFVGTKTIKLPKLSVDGAGDYDRDTGYAQGGVAVSYEDHVLAYDRGRKFRIDVIDNDEAAFDLYRQVALQYVRTREIPEIDAVRFAETWAAATRSGTQGTVVSKDLTTSDSALVLYDAAEKTLNEKEVPEEGRILFCTNDFYAMLKSDEKVARRMDVQGNTGNIDRRVALLDGITPIIRVPQARFYSLITLLDGTTSGQTAGGYTPTTGGFDLNFIYANKVALRGVIKRRFSKIVEPAANQSADAYDIFYRCHHDLIVKDNETAGIYVHKKATART